ncbi:MAG TPA: glycoside hydrolase family 3 N-terminal domain-containing protein [Gemmatimonadaceae bacterium]|nr:glycoside hydrolase family 3 N-terminal domain-containing protein [Gemmatimonadaceae bacterium]
MKRALKVLGLIVGSLVLLAVALVGYFVYGRSSDIRAAEKLIGRPADTIQIGGFTFRDLNKNGKLDLYEDLRQPIPTRVENLLVQMTLEEKAGMFFHNIIAPGKNGEIAGPSEPMNFMPVQIALFERNINFFNLLSLGGAQETARWLNNVQHLAERTRLGIPATIATDPRHAVSMQKSVFAFDMREFSHWPDPIGFAAIGDSTLVQQFARYAASDYRTIGIHMALHPMADVATEPRWARINGTFGEDANLAAKLTAAYVRGFQGDTLGPTSVATVTKHFAGGGPQKDGWDPHFRYGKDQVYPGHNLSYHLIPFRAAIAAGTALMMPYYGVPVGLTKEDVGFNFNRQMITDLLRDTLGFKGVVLTDWGLLTPPKLFGVDLERFIPFGGVKDYGVESLPPYQKARKALDAGVDQFGGEMRPDYLVQLVNEGAIPQSRLDQSVRKLLTLKFQLGLFENPYVDVAAVPKTVGTPEARRLGDETQRRSQVLLINTETSGKATLPLASGTRIYVENLDTAIAAKYGTVVKTPEEADVAILNLEPPFDHDRGTLFHQGRLYYTDEELKPVRAIMRLKPTVITVYLDRPLVIPQLADSARAIVGNFGASNDAILDVLFGRFKPEGKLPFEMPSSWDAVLKQKEDVPFDSENPLFRFGHGLRYR